MHDKELAQELVYRLNNLIENEDVKRVVQDMLAKHFHWSEGVDPSVCHVVRAHPTIQAWEDGGDVSVRMLGLLNGIVGAIPSGHREGWGYICILMDSERLIRFELTDE